MTPGELRALVEAAPEWAEDVKQASRESEDEGVLDDKGRAVARLFTALDRTILLRLVTLWEAAEAQRETDAGTEAGDIADRRMRAALDALGGG